MNELEAKSKELYAKMDGLLSLVEREGRVLTDVEKVEIRGYEVQLDEVERLGNIEDKPYKVTMRAVGSKQRGDNILDYIVRGEELPLKFRSVAVGSGTAGGFFLSDPSAAMGLTFQTEGLLGKCRRIQTPPNATTLQLASFMESDWTLKGPFGIGISPTQENGTITETDLTAHYVKYEVFALAGLISASRIWWDSTEGASRIISEAFNTNLRWKLDSQIISGSGVGQIFGPDKLTVCDHREPDDCKRYCIERHFEFEKERDAFPAPGRKLHLDCVTRRFRETLGFGGFRRAQSLHCTVAKHTGISAAWTSDLC